MKKWTEPNYSSTREGREESNRTARTKSVQNRTAVPLKRPYRPVVLRYNTDQTPCGLSGIIAGLPVSSRG